jgi:hypothetical protein
VVQACGASSAVATPDSDAFASAWWAALWATQYEPHAVFLDGLLNRQSLAKSESLLAAEDETVDDLVGAIGPRCRSAEEDLEVLLDSRALAGDAALALRTTFDQRSREVGAVLTGASPELVELKLTEYVEDVVEKILDFRVVHLFIAKMGHRDCTR